MNDEDFDSGLVFDNSYAKQLEGFYVSYIGDKAPQPKLLKLNLDLAHSIGLNTDSTGEQSDPISSQSLAAMLSGGTVPKGASPLAQAYAGHQFGGFSPQLGDGRALLLGEVLDKDNQRKDIHLKGSGRTVFSRGGDGKAAIGPVLREYLLAEAMHNLAVPTTRALAVVATGERVMREKHFNGAVLARVASSHIRVGTFQFKAARGETEQVKLLADYAINRHYPDLKNTDNCYLEFLQAVCDKQALLIAKWMSIGFVHGVMNTDNTTISGETIDYGPCAFIDGFDPNIVFSSIDKQGRYAYSNQPSMALWNLARLAETLLPLIATDEELAVELATKVINDIEQMYQSYWLTQMRLKLGLATQEQQDVALINNLLEIMAEQKVDFTQLFRALGNVLGGDSAIAQSLFVDPKKFDQWYLQWSKRLATDIELSVTARVESMNKVNPIYIPRNHKVEEALQAAQDKGDLKPFEKLLLVMSTPFKERAGFEDYAVAAPENFGNYTTYCGT